MVSLSYRLRTAGDLCGASILGTLNQGDILKHKPTFEPKAEVVIMISYILLVVSHLNIFENIVLNTINVLHILYDKDMLREKEN